MYCNNNCRICDRLIISTSVTVGTVAGVDTLLIDVPTANYGNKCRYCIIVAQTIPDTATINMPVAVTIAGDTTTVYPLVKCNCAQVSACAIRTRTRYPVIVSTTATGGVFKVLRGLSCAPNNALASLPAPATTAPAAVMSINEVVTPGRATRTVTTTTKEVISRE